MTQQFFFFKKKKVLSSLLRPALVGLWVAVKLRGSGFSCMCSQYLLRAFSKLFIDFYSFWTSSENDGLFSAVNVRVEFFLFTGLRTQWGPSQKSCSGLGWSPQWRHNIWKRDFLVWDSRLKRRSGNCFVSLSYRYLPAELKNQRPQREQWTCSRQVLEDFYI